MGSEQKQARYCDEMLRVQHTPPGRDGFVATTRSSLKEWPLPMHTMSVCVVCVY